MQIDLPGVHLPHSCLEWGDGMQRIVSSDSGELFAGLRVAVTGGTSGLGLALVRELVHRGASVAFVARTPEGVERVAREEAGAHGIVGDVSVKEDIYPVALQIVGLLGGLDVLVNNASSLGRRHWPRWEIRPARTWGGLWPQTW